MPVRFSHWSFGKAFHRMKMQYDFNLSRIYELVINSDPCYAFLLDANSLLQNKVIAAHVLAHSDFFKNNYRFAHTSRSMVETMAIHAARLRRYEMRYGRDRVEELLDAALALQEQIDPYTRPAPAHAVGNRPARPKKRDPDDVPVDDEEDMDPADVPRRRGKSRDLPCTSWSTPAAWTTGSETCSASSETKCYIFGRSWRRKCSTEGWRRIGTCASSARWTCPTTRRKSSPACTRACWQLPASPSTHTIWATTFCSTFTSGGKRPARRNESATGSGRPRHGKAV